MFMVAAPRLLLGAVLTALLAASALCRPDTFYFRTWPQDVRPCASAPLRLPCTVSDARSISLRWTRDDRPLQLSSRVTTDGAGLVVSRVLPEDAGKYACIAHNTTSGFALTSLPATVAVLWVGSRSVVSLAGRPRGNAPRAGESIALRCRVSGGPGLLYSWHRNGVPLAAAATAGRRRLSLVNVSASGHNGAYTCSAALSADKLTRRDPIAGGERQLCGGRQQSLLSTPYVLALPDRALPRLIVPPTPLLVAGGSTAKFRCRFEEGTDVRWKYPLETMKKVVITNDTLSVQDARPADEGYYACTGVRRDTGRQQTFAVRLGIAYLSSRGPQLEPSPDDGGRLVVAEGSTVRVRCLPPEGLPVPTATWHGDGGYTLPRTGTLRAEDDVFVLEAVSIIAPSTDGTSPFTALTSKHTASCTATNIAGSSTAQLTILATRRPVVLAGPKEQQVEEGETATMRCRYSAAAAPLTSVFWTKDGQKVAADGQRVVEWQEPSVVDSAGAELRVRWLQPNDSAVYACHVLTKGHTPESSSEARLQVIERLRFSPAPKNGRAKVGGTLVLPCTARSHVAPTITWSKLKPHGGVGPLPWGIANSGGNLTILHARREHDGWYVCSAATPHHRPINASVRLLVTESPSASIPGGGVVTGVQDEAFMVECHVTGQPRPHVSWRRTPPMLDSWWVDANGTLRTSRVARADEGLYTCQASNLAGTATAHVTIAVAVGLIGRDKLRRTISVAVGGAGVYVGLVLVLLLYCRHRRLMRKPPPTPPPTALTPESDPSVHFASPFPSVTEYSPCGLEQSIELRSLEQPLDLPSLEQPENNNDLSVIYSSRLYGGDEDLNLKVPLNFPKPPARRAVRRKTKRRPGRSWRLPGRSQSAARSDLQPGSAEVGSCATDFELQRSRASLGSSLGCQVTRPRPWSMPFHATRPPEPTSLHPIL